MWILRKTIFEFMESKETLTVWKTQKIESTSKCSGEKACISKGTEDKKREASVKCEFCGKSFSKASNVKQHLRNGSCKRKCCHCFQNVSGSDSCMALHLQKHMHEEYLTIPQLKAIRKQLRLFQDHGKNNTADQPIGRRGGPQAPMLHQNPMPRQTYEMTRFLSTQNKRGQQILTTLWCASKSDRREKNAAI